MFFSPCQYLTLTLIPFPLRPLALTVSQVLVSYVSMGKLEEAEEVRRLVGITCILFNPYILWYFEVSCMFEMFEIL